MNAHLHVGDETLAFGARKVIVTHPERIMFPSDRITKGDLVHYYRDVAHWILPYLHDRPLTLQRWPRGIRGFSFFEKRAPRGMPDWIPTTSQPRADAKGTVTYPLACDASSLAWFANLGAITLHVWLSRLHTISSPDFLLVDLDPVAGCTTATLARVALAARDELDAVGLKARVKTTGGHGLHVLASITARSNYERARAMNEALAHRLCHLLPRHTTIERTKSMRPRGRVYIDWAQEGLGKTVVPPYTVRAKPGAPVSMPIPWSEVEAMAVERTPHSVEGAFARWNMESVRVFLAERGDPWAASFGHPHDLERAMERARTRWGHGRSH
ncbi:MAG TPA: non-homologous end-joining DNA ligase [Polyangiaceae bacterium]|jgi:bifunctional non-homologous end joining protein LigD